MSQNSANSNAFWNWVRGASASRKMAYALAAASALAGIATVATITGHSGEAYGLDTVVSLLYIDGILLLLLAVIVAKRLAQVWMERRRGTAGAGLQVRLVVLFSLVAVTPAILVAIFSALFLHFGMQSWFSERVNKALNQSRIVANAYLIDHRNNIQTDALAIANELNLNAPQLMRNKVLFDRLLSTQAAVRSLSETVVIDSGGQILARAQFSLTPKLENLPVDALASANQGRIAVLDSENDDRMRALVKLNRFIDAYLLVERFVDARVNNHIDDIKKAVSEYRKMESERGGIQVSFIIIFLVVSLLLLLAAAWIGLNVSTQLARPISRLISATDEASQGNLDVRVEVSEEEDEISSLGHAFNNMANQLENQQKGLLDANREMDERRRFTEAVLTGVSAGVIGLDSEGRLHLPNRSASELLDTNLDAHKGNELANVIPEMAELLAQAKSQPNRTHQEEIELLRNGQSRTLLARIAAETIEAEVIGYVVTFDDVTELFSAQRKAAWADVARRIAHEIKNPLTPIQLSAERLRRKYENEITSDPETFINCTDTIVRQVEDIGRMVDEFSSFARMPQPSIKSENLSEICREAIFLERNRTPEITFNADLPKSDVSIHCDRRQIAQALTNLLKNAAESIEARLSREHDQGATGEIRLRFSLSPLPDDGGQAAETKIVIEDNGIGLPEDRDRLTEPYVTTREKGTGLGLAIVRKIMEDHDGKLELDNVAGGGARITMIFHNFEATDQPPKAASDDDDEAAIHATMLGGENR